MEDDLFRRRTKDHIDKVRALIEDFERELNQRMNDHDQSKFFDDTEAKLFAKYTDKLSDVTYDSEEYWELMEKLKPALEHHYENNRHHPEHWESGIDDMNLADIIEMFFDWCASSQRHKDGDVRESIEKNKDRFDLSDQLAQIFENTVDDFNL